MQKPFSVCLVGSFHSLEILDSRGREVYDMNEAIDVVESQYNDEWKEIYNGIEGISREEWLETNVR